MRKQSHLLSDGSCPKCGKKLKIIKPGQKIWKPSVLIEYERENIRHIKCSKCNEMLVCT